MRITEEITRECCDPEKDLKPYTGVTLFGDTPICPDKFCVHCGQLWVRNERGRWGRLKGDSDADR